MLGMRCEVIDAEKTPRRRDGEADNECDVISDVEHIHMKMFDDQVDQSGSPE